MRFLLAACALVCTMALVQPVLGQCPDCQCPVCECQGPHGILARLRSHRHADAQVEAGYRGPAATPGYVGPENYGYWADYGWFGPQYGGWYGPGGWNYYSRTGDYAAPFLPPPSMRGPPAY